MQRKDLGERLGKIDSDGIAEYYPNCKVRFDGSHYIAIPHTTNPTRRTKRKEAKITVTENDGKFALEEKPENAVVTHESVSNKEVIAEHKESQSVSLDESKKSIKRITTRKELFDELYDKYLYMKPKERKKAIYADMQPLFATETDLEYFVETNCFRRWRNVVIRRQRFVRKALNIQFQYFVTFTYSDEKHTEESFKQRLLETLRRLATRHNWRYMGVWERGTEKKRLHFHALVKIPDDGMVGEFIQTRDYNKKTGKSKMITQNTFFIDRFGRNEFDVICGRSYEYGKAIGYIMKYMEKRNTKTVYSRGLYEYFRSDIMGKDVVCNTNILDETSNKLILADNFMCIDEGVLMGEVSEETIDKMPKSA